MLKNDMENSGISKTMKSNGTFRSDRDRMPCTINRAVFITGLQSIPGEL